MDMKRCLEDRKRYSLNIHTQYTWFLYVFLNWKIAKQKIENKRIISKYIYLGYILFFFVSFIFSVDSMLSYFIFYVCKHHNKYCYYTHFIIIMFILYKKYYIASLEKSCTDNLNMVFS